MTSKILKIEKSVQIRPLRKRNAQGELYQRRPDVQTTLLELSQLPLEEVAERAAVTDANDPQYIPSECILHFVRQSKQNRDTQPCEALFTLLRQRILKAVPVFERRLDDAKVTDDPYQLEVRDRVLDKFVEMLCIDREEYDDRLDYYEIMFNSAIAALRVTARRDTSERAKRENSESIVVNEDKADSDDDFGAVLRNLNEPSDNKNAVYRFELLSAISDLPDDERRVIELLIHGYMLKEVAEIVKCTEKTARTRRNRARARLAKVWGREDLV